MAIPTIEAEPTSMFSMDVPEFDSKTYWGRFEEFRATANPFHAFYTDSRIKQMQKLLEE